MVLTKEDIGKQFKVIDNTCCHDFYIGEIVAFKGFDGDGHAMFNNSEDFWWLDEDYEVERV